VTYHISAQREAGNQVKLVVDGEPVVGTIVPVPEDKTDVSVTAMLY
jgi:hypothetical protein